MAGAEAGSNTFPAGGSPAYGGSSPRGILMGEADHLVVREIGADHPFGDAGLKRLVDHEPGACEVRVAALEELFER